MSKLVQLDREQLKRLDEESLVELILVLQQQMAAQQELIQKLQDQLAASRPAASEERQTKESAPLWPAAAWGATWAQGAHLDAGGGTGP